MLDDIEGAHQIERIIAEGQHRHRARLQRTAPAQPCQRRRADVNELRALDRQPWSETRRHLEPSARPRQERIHERPSIEPLRLNQTGTGPEHVVETTIRIEKVLPAAHLRTLWFHRLANVAPADSRLTRICINFKPSLSLGPSCTIRALSFLFWEGTTSTGFIHSSRLSMFLWMLPMTPRISVIRISGSGLRVSRFTAATISSACASAADFKFLSFSLRCSAVEAFASH